ncbi:hypothetical protein V8F33_012376 [Rhypophila sp. PSN 637]
MDEQSRRLRQFASAQQGEFSWDHHCSFHRRVAVPLTRREEQNREVDDTTPAGNIDTPTGNILGNSQVERPTAELATEKANTASLIELDCVTEPSRPNELEATGPQPSQLDSRMITGTELECNNPRIPELESNTPLPTELDSNPHIVSPSELEASGARYGQAADQMMDTRRDTETPLVSPLSSGSVRSINGYQPFPYTTPMDVEHGYGYGGAATATYHYLPNPPQHQGPGGHGFGHGQ